MAVNKIALACLLITQIYHMTSHNLLSAAEKSYPNNQITFKLSTSNLANAAITGKVTESEIDGVPIWQFREGACTLPAADLINPKYGMFECEFYTGWSGKDYNKHFIISIFTTEANRMYVYLDEFSRPQLWVRTNFGKTSGMNIGLTDFISLKSLPYGLCHSIIGRWDFRNEKKGMLELYWDGKLIGRESNINCKGLVNLNKDTKMIIGTDMNGKYADIAIKKLVFYRGWPRLPEMSNYLFEKNKRIANAKVIVANLQKSIDDYKKQSTLIEKLYGHRYAEISYDADQAKNSLVHYTKLTDKTDTADWREKVSWYSHWAEVAFENIKNAVVEAGALSTANDDKQILDGLLLTSLEKTSKNKFEFSAKIRRTLSLSVARNEYISFQIVAMSYAQSLKNVEVKVGPLCDEDGKNCNYGESSVRKVGYVTVYDEERNPHQVPDPLLDENTVDFLDSRDIQPFWITQKISKEAKPGKYTCEVTINGKTLTGENVTSKAQVTFNVFPVILPDTSTLKTAFGLTPSFLRIQHGIACDTSLAEMVDKYVRAMLKYKITPKPYLRYRAEKYPWKDDIFFLQPKYILTADDNIEIDWSDFDKQIEQYIPLGLNTIMVGTRCWVVDTAVGTQEKELWVYDQKQEKYRTVQYAWMSKEFKKVVKQIMVAWQKHLEEKGWLDMAYVYTTDEPNTESFGRIKELHLYIHQVAPKLPMLTTKAPIANLDEIDIYCPQLQVKPEVLIKEQALGKHFWYYCCIGPLHPYPNFHLLQPATSHRIAFWFTYDLAGEGFLYWEVACWNHRGPWRDPQWFESARPFAGDGSLFYTGPDGPLGSIRLENIRDGIEDFELLHIIEKRNDYRARHALWSRLGLNEPYSSCAKWNTDWEAMLFYRDRILALAAEVSKNGK